jgi:hypothetical protein
LNNSIERGITMFKKKDSRRRTLMVNHSFQHRLIKDVSRIPIIALMAGMLIMAFCFRNMIQDAVDAGVRLNGIGLFVGCMTGYALLACFVTINLAYRISNRIAGPVYRLHMSMEEFKKGNSDCMIKLRDGDYLMETAEIFNQMVTEIENRDKVSSSMEDEQGEEREMEQAGAVGSRVPKSTNP